MPAYYYSSTAGTYILTGDVNASATIIVLNTVTGLPTSTPYKVVLDPGQPSEEIVKVTAVAGTSLTVVRGWNGSSAANHAAGATVRHMVTAEDFTLSRTHEDSTTAHGATGAVVGTTNSQTISNKDFSNGTNTFPSSLVTLNGAQTLLTKIFQASATNQNPIKIIRIAGQGANLLKIEDESTNQLFAISPTGSVTAAGDVTAPNITTLRSDVNTNTTDITALKKDSGVVTNAISALSGWSITVQQVEKVGRLVSVYLGGTRTGATITTLALGNLANTDIATISASYRPVVPQSGTTVASGAGWFFSIQPDGTITLTAGGPGNDFPNGEAFSVAFTYLSS